MSLGGNGGGGRGDRVGVGGSFRDTERGVLSSRPRPAWMRRRRCEERWGGIRVRMSCFRPAEVVVEGE